MPGYRRDDDLIRWSSTLAKCSKTLVEQKSIHPERVQLWKANRSSFILREMGPPFSSDDTDLSPCPSIVTVAQTSGPYLGIYFFKLRMYFTKSWIWSPLSLPS